MAAIVIVLLLVLAVGSTAAALVGVFLYRRRLEPKQSASATSFGNIFTIHYTCALYLIYTCIHYTCALYLQYESRI